MAKKNELGMLRKGGVITQEIIKYGISKQSKNKKINKKPLSIQKYLQRRPTA